MEKLARSELTNLKQKEVATSRPREEFKRRLRTLLQQEQQCTKRAFLQQQLFQPQIRKQPNNREMLLLNLNPPLPSSRSVSLMSQETLQYQTFLSGVPCKTSNRRSSAIVRRLSSSRKIKRELADAEGRPAFILRGEVAEGVYSLSEEKTTELRHSAVHTASNDLHSPNGSALVRGTKCPTNKSELGSSAAMVREYITISDSSEDSSRCSSPPPRVNKQKQEQGDGNRDLSMHRRTTPKGLLRVQPPLSNSSPASCKRRGNSQDSRIRYNDFSRGYRAERSGGGKRRSRLLMSPSFPLPAPGGNAGSVQEFCLSRARHVSSRDARCSPCVRVEEVGVATQPLAPEHMLEVSEEHLPDPKTPHEEGPGIPGIPAAAEGRSPKIIPSAVSDWPECVVSMLGPDVFNLLKEEPGLVHATSKTSGMSLFHHILRRPSKDDEQVLELLKCIYEDKPLRERVSLPSLYALKCDKGQTLAFYAAAYGHAKCLKWILEQIGGASRQRQFLDIRDSEGDTPLHYAVKNGHVNVIELLLHTVPEMLNKQRNNGQTPLFDAIERPAIVRLLLRRGADPRVKCNRGLTALETAADELRWKRLCSSRSCKTLPKRLSFSVHLLKKAAGELSKGGSSGSNRSDESASKSSTVSTAGSSYQSKPAEANMMNAAVDDERFYRDQRVDCQLESHPVANAECSKGGIPASPSGAADWQQSDSSTDSSNRIRPSIDGDT